MPKKVLSCPHDPKPAIGRPHQGKGSLSPSPSWVILKGAGFWKHHTWVLREPCLSSPPVETWENLLLQDSMLVNPPLCEAERGEAASSSALEPWALPFKPLLPGLTGFLLILFLFLPPLPPSSASSRICLWFVSEEDPAYWGWIRVCGRFPRGPQVPCFTMI